MLDYRTTLQKPTQWVQDVAHAMRTNDRREAQVALRAVLQALRDHLPVDEAVHLGAQLPRLLRGLYYEGWRPSGKPLKERSRDAFLDEVRQRAHRPSLDAATAASAVFGVIAHRVSQGEVEDVRHCLPKGIRGLWPDEEAVSAVYLGDAPEEADEAAPAAVSEAPADDAAESPPVGLSAQRVLGARVLDPLGETLGHVDDLVIDPETGHVSSAVISFGGLLGFREKVFFAPFKLLHWKEGEEAFDLQLSDPAKGPQHQLPRAHREHWWPSPVERGGLGGTHTVYGGTRL